MLAPFPKWRSLCFLLCTVCMCPCCLEFTLEVMLGTCGWADNQLCNFADTAASFLFRPSFGPQLLAPGCCFLARCCTHKTITSIQHIVKGMETAQEAGKQNRDTKKQPNNNNKKHTESFYLLKCVTGHEWTSLLCETACYATAKSIGIKNINFKSCSSHLLV